ncbi:MAG: CHASE2 domain-containing protein [Leptolyngbya sp. SIOISBB]|nr:CHASE2 domain-containing protein [Leptolyngbya sp. SIOISBB]
MLRFLKAPTLRLKRLARKSSKWPIGYAIIAGILMTRWLGLFSNLELLTLDFLLRNRLPEPPDEEIVIILFDLNIVQNQGGREELTEQQIAQLLKIVFAADPAAVGLNIFLDETSDDPGREQLIELFETHANLIGVQKALPPRKIDPPIDIPEAIVAEQFGINDVPIDQDGQIRRTFLGSYLPDSEEIGDTNPFKFSFSFKLATAYLASQGYALENHPRKSQVPIFQQESDPGFFEVPLLNAHSGGYHREANINDIQSLLNFRAGSNTFEIVEAFQFFNRSLDPTFLKDKVVIIGKTDSDFPRFLSVAASSSLIQTEAGEDAIIPRIGIVGSELEAHSASQIIDAVIADRPLIYTLPSSLETFLIMLSGLTGIVVSLSFASSARSAIALLSFTVVGFGLCYWCIAQFGLWLPMTPMAVCMPLSGMVYLSFNYRSQRRVLRTQQAKLIEAKVLEAERRKAIERAFSAIHAGPLQRLSSLMRSTKDGNLQQDYVIQELKSLNQEIRGVGERLRQEAIGDVYFFYSGGDIKLDLTHPMHEVLYEVYSLAVQRKLPGFESVKVRAVTIEPFNCKRLNLDIKRQLCWFLEESLQNIGKHAVGTTRIQVSGKHIDEFYRLKIEDNGPGIQSSHVGEGTQSFYRLETLLHGKFARFSKARGGTVCELSWPSSFNTS